MKPSRVIGALLFLFLATFVLLYFKFGFLSVSTAKESKREFFTTKLFEKKNQPETVSLLAVGDIMLAREVAIRSTDPSWAFENVSSFLQDADITFANLESPTNDYCPPTSTGMIFCAPESQYSGLIENGIDVVSVANNHAGDQKQKGLEVTKSFLQNAHIKAAGYGDPQYIAVGDTTFGFLAYNSVNPETAGIAWAETERIKKDVAELKNTSDIAIVSFHWGNEYTTKLTNAQKEFAHAAIDSGADVVIGHHPHWIQGIEYYHGKPIFYSLGNFIFDQMWSQKTREGLAVKLTFEDKKLGNVELFPILIENYGQPRLMEGKQKEEMVTYIQSLSDSR